MADTGFSKGFVLDNSLQRSLPDAEGGSSRVDIFRFQHGKRFPFQFIWDLTIYQYNSFNTRIVIPGLSPGMIRSTFS